MDETAILNAKSAPAYHPEFADLTADVVIRSKEGTLFRMHSLTLRISSGFFRVAFSLPQGGGTGVAEEDIITMEEDERTLEGLFRMISAKRLPSMENFDLVESIAYAAEKYDMEGPLSLIRLIVTLRFLSDSPFQVYALACHMGWFDIVQGAATAALSYDPFDPIHMQSLSRVPGSDLLKLLKLYRDRQQAFGLALEDRRFVSGPFMCSNCHTNYSAEPWVKLKLKLVKEMQVCSSGKDILNGNFERWPEAEALRTHKCTRCPTPACVWATLVESVKTIIRDGLPKSVELSDSPA